MVKPKRPAPFIRSSGFKKAAHPPAGEFDQVIKIHDMEEPQEIKNNKGGRPVKAIKRNSTIGVRCTTVERFLLETKAKSAGLTVSEFLRVGGLTGKIDMRKKPFPTEILQAIADLNHIAANLNQIAKKRNSYDEINALERAELLFAVGQLKQFVNGFRNYFA